MKSKLSIFLGTFFLAIALGAGAESVKDDQRDLWEIWADQYTSLFNPVTTVQAQTSSLFDLSDTWNDAGSTFNAIKMDVTDTASQDDSNFIHYLLSGTTQWRVDKSSSLYLIEKAGASANVANYGQIYIKNDTPNTLWFDDDAGTGFQLGLAAASGDLKADGSVPLTADWDVGAFKITALQLESDIAIGTPGIVITSTTTVPNLNAFYLQGTTPASFASSAQGSTADSATQPGDNISTLTNDSGFIATLEGTALLSTGEAGGTKFLREDGDGTSSWQSVAGGSGAFEADVDTQMTAAVSVVLDHATNDELVLDLTYTVNKAAGADTAVLINKISTADPGTSRSLVIQKDGVDQFIFLDNFTGGSGQASLGLYSTGFGLRKQTNKLVVVAGGNDQVGLQHQWFGVRSGTEFGWASGSPASTNLDVVLLREAAGILAQRDGLNPQTIGIYKTYTNGTDYERLRISGGIFNSASDGTGTTQDIDFQFDGVSKFTIDPSGNVVVEGTIDSRDVAADGTKLDGIEALADVTDTANVTSAGALMDSEVDADLKTFVLPASTTISAFGATVVDDADAATARATLGVDVAGTDNSTDVTLAGTPDYITLVGQVITRNDVDLAADITGKLPIANLADGTDGQLITWGTTGVIEAVSTGTVGQILTSAGAGAPPLFAVPAGVTESFIIAISDETTDLETGLKVTFRMPYAFTISEVRASVTDAPTGSILIIDINESGSTIMTTNKLSIDATEKTSTTAATAPGITDSSLADDAEITIDIDQIGSTLTGAGAKVTIIGEQT